MIERLKWIIVFLLVGSFYIWTTDSNHIGWRFGSEQKDYYNLLVHGFLDGQLSLKAEVPAELLQCPDPYDPAQRPPGVALHDASLFHGKYYIYYGVVPAVVALLPFRVLTGTDLPVPIAVLGFALAAYAVALLIIADLRRRFFPRCGATMTALLAIGFGFASWAPVLLRRSNIYELPITCGAFFAMIGIACLIQAIVRERGREAWLAGASLAWGLAIGARPTYLLAPACLLLAVTFVLRSKDQPVLGRGVAWRLLLAALLALICFYVPPSARGAFFAMIGIACLIQVIVRERGRVAWLAGAGLAGGLAIGTRPIYLLVLASLLLIVTFALRTKDDPVFGRGLTLRLWAAVLLPLISVGVLLAAYNYARFGQITEFGVSYILSSVHEAKIEHFRLRYVPWNLFAYFFSPGDWARYFPFFHERPILWPKPLQHFGMDVAFGILANVPVYWMAMFAFRSGRCGQERPMTLRVIVAAIAIAAFAVIGMVVMFYAAMARYIGDFAPALALLAVIGSMAVLHDLAPRPAAWRRRLGATTLAVIIVVSVFVITVFSVGIYDRLRTYNAGTYAALARISDAPNYWFGRMPPGAVELRLSFADPNARGPREEILCIGWGEQTDRLLVTYPDPTHVQFEFDHRGAVVSRSESVPITLSGEQIVRVAMGVLYPPLSWPGYERAPRSGLDRIFRSLFIDVDGRPLHVRRVPISPQAPDSVRFGGEGTTMRFSGRILQISHEPIRATLDRVSKALTQLPPELALPSDGVWRLRVTFRESPVGRREPLLVSGVTGQGDLLAVEYLPDRHLRWVLDHWGSPGKSSDSFAYEPGRTYLIEVGHAGFSGRSGVALDHPSELTVTIDGVPVWSLQTVLYPVTGGDLYLGSNPIGGSSSEETFSGNVRLEP